MNIRAVAKPKALLLATLTVVLSIVLACGSSATSTPVPADTAVAPTVTSAPPASGDTAVPPTSTPRPVATATTAPVVSAPDVNPGKVTFMLQGWGNERFDNIHNFGGNNNYLRLMHVLPVAGNSDTKLLPGIFSKWEASPDGLSQIFTVDTEGVKFHDGSDMTIDDVLWTFRHTWDKECLEKCTSSGAASTAEVIDAIEQTASDQITITFRVADSGFVFQWLSEPGSNTMGIHPKRPVLYDTALEEAYDKNPIMAGHMSFVEHVPSERISLERFDDYYYQPANGFPEDRRMKFQLLDILLVPEEATRAASLRAGQADVAPVSLQTRDQVEAGGGRLIFGEQGVVFWVFFPHTYREPFTPFSDKNVRKAMSYAIDKELMMDRLYGGPEVAVAKGWAMVTPSTIGYSPDFDPLPFDPDKARQLLADAGHPNGEGFGKVIVNTWVSTALPFLPESAQVAADFWRKELNLDVEVNVGDETSLKRAWRAGDLQGQIMWNDSEARGDAAGVARALYGVEGSDLAFHDDPELFALVQEAIAVFDPELRPQVLNALFERLFDEQIELPIGYVNIPWAVGPRIADWQPWSMAFFPSAPWTLTLK